MEDAQTQDYRQERYCYYDEEYYLQVRSSLQESHLHTCGEGAQSKGVDTQQELDHGVHDDEPITATPNLIERAHECEMGQDENHGEDEISVEDASIGLDLQSSLDLVVLVHLSQKILH